MVTKGEAEKPSSVMGGQKKKEGSFQEKKEREKRSRNSSGQGGEGKKGVKVLT